MATATTTSFSKFVILLGDGATPTEVFTPICGLTSRGITGNADVVTTEVPDCANEDLPSWQEKDVKSIGASMTGSGVWSREAHGVLWDWFLAGTKKNVKVRWVDSAIGDPEYFAGPAVITALENTVEKGGRLNKSLTLEFTAKPAVTDKAA